MLKEKLLTKKYLIIAVILAIIILGVVVWLLFFKSTKRDLTGTWLLREVMEIDQKFEYVDINEKLIISDNKNAIIYIDDVEECRSTIEDNKIVCSGKTFDIVDSESSTALYLTDQKMIYKYYLEGNEPNIIKQGLSIRTSNWKIDEKNDTMTYPSIDEINNMSKNFFVENEYGTFINMAFPIKLTTPGEKMKYTFEMINDGTEDVNNNFYSFGTDSNDSLDLNNLEIDGSCYKDINHNDYIGGNPTPFKSSDILYCEINLNNKTVNIPTDLTVKFSWKITK